MRFIRKKVFLITLIVIGLFVIYFGITSLISSAEKNASPPSKNADIKMLEKIEENLSGKYDTGGYGIRTHFVNNTKNIDIDVFGSQEYYESVKNEIQDIVKSLIKSTEFEAYNVNVNKYEIVEMMNEDELLERHSLLNKIAKTIDNELSTNHANQINGINMNITPPDSPQVLTIEINTILERKNQEATVISKEMENTIYKLIETKLSSNKLIKEVQQSDSIRVYIFNKNGEKIN